MATINYYLDKPNKKGYSPIHMRINCNGEQIKLSTKAKVEDKKFDREKQLVKGDSKEAVSINHFLNFLKERANHLLNNSKKKTFTFQEVKEKLHSYIEGYGADTQVNLVKEDTMNYGKRFTFIDFFAGAGGFSEGFLQAENDNKFFDFLLGSDINENCELTHVVRYNHQLGLDAEFLCQDITEPSFLPNLLERLKGKDIDVICGGPPCQSFSLAGKRKKFDKKDDLFAHYLQIIKTLQPKYFVMENVKGILTKEKGKIKDTILEEIRSIIDIKEIGKFEKFIWELKREVQKDEFIFDCLIKRIDFEKQKGLQLENSQESYIKVLESKFKVLTPKIVDYKTSKTDKRINTIRHGFGLLLRRKQLEKLQYEIIKEKDQCYISGDEFEDSFTSFINELEVGTIISKMQKAFDDLNVSGIHEIECANIITALQIYTSSFEGCVGRIKRYCNKARLVELNNLMEGIRLYKINAPFVANASDYGVPQNRERVLFIGCRKDQPLIETIPATVTESEKVTIFEALHDLDFIDNNEEIDNYEKINLTKKYNGSAKKIKALIKKRSIEGKNGELGLKTYAEWSKEGRLSSRFKVAPPFYVKSNEALESGLKKYGKLHNHKTSNQSPDVVERLKVIIESGGYKEAQESLEKLGLSSKKRSYNLLNPEKQSSTIMTIADDYVHFNSPRALTVREMARLQSFDDDFVFQGKRSTGGNKRRTEIPQFTLVGNAVPPLMARAVAMEILNHIK